MSRFTKLRELATRARDLDAEAGHMSGAARWDRRIEADECRAKAEFLAGRIDRDEYHARLVECLDARAYPVD